MINNEKRRQKTALEHVLLGLVPYTRENIDLAFHPNRFFNELDRLHGVRKANAKRAYDNAIRRGYIALQNDKVVLKSRALDLIAPYQAQVLGNDAQLLVIFDIPEEHSSKRVALRRLLQHLEFTQVQRSVWVSGMDYRQLLLSRIQEMDIGKYVEIHESLRLFPN